MQIHQVFEKKKSVNFLTQYVYTKLVDAGGYNRNERERGGGREIDDLRWVDREGWRKKINLL